MCDEFKRFLNDVMIAIINEDKSISYLLNKQYENSVMEKLEFTGVGFYAEYRVINQNFKLKDKPNLELGNVQVKLASLKCGIGFVLYIRGGFITMLEGFTYDEPFPEKICGYTLSE